MSWFSTLPPPSPPSVDFGGALLSSFLLTTAIAALGVIFFVRWSTQNYVAKLKAAHQAEIEKLRAQLDTPHARGGKGWGDAFFDHVRRHVHVHGRPEGEDMGEDAVKEAEDAVKDAAREDAAKQDAAEAERLAKSMVARMDVA